MNPANMQGMGGPMQAPMQGQQSQPQGLQRLLLNALQQQPVPPGWQQTVGLDQRLTLLHQLATTFQLATQNNPEINQNNRQQTMLKLVHGAVEFEKKAFITSPNLQTYTGIITRKLNELRAQRQHIADNSTLPNAQHQAQMQFQNPMSGMQMPGPNSNAFNPGFSAQQMPPNMQATQQMMMQANQIQMQPNQLGMFQQGMPQPGLPQQTLPQQQQPFQQQHPQPRPAAEVQNPMSALQNQESIARLAQSLAQRARQNGEIQKVQEMLAQRPLQQRQAMQQAGIDPVMYYFRQQAVQMLNKRAQGPPLQNQMNQQGNLNLSRGPGIAQNQLGGINLANGSGLVPGQSSAPLDVQQAFAIQQQEAQRQHEAGELVVPPSNPMGAPYAPLGTLQNLQNNAPGRPNQIVNGMLQQSQQAFNNQSRQGQVKQVQQTPSQTNNKQPKPNMQGQMPQQTMPAPTPLQGQIGGLHASQQVHIGSPMPNLNQATIHSEGPKSMQPTPQQPSLGLPQNGGRGVSMNPMTAPPMKNAPSQQGPVATPTNIQFPDNFPQQLRERVMGEPLEKVINFIQQWQHGYAKQQSQNAGQANNSMPQPGGLPQAVSQVSMVGNQMQNQTGPSGGQQQNMHAASQQSINSQQQPQNKQQLHAMMDAMALHKPLLKKMCPTLDIPEQVKTWSNLKQWIRQNGAIFQSLAIDANQLLGLQNFQYQKVKESQQKKQQEQQQQQFQQQPTQQQQPPTQPAAQAQMQPQQQTIPQRQAGPSQLQQKPQMTAQQLSQLGPNNVMQAQTNLMQQIPLPPPPNQNRSQSSLPLAAIFDIVPQLQPTPEDITNFRIQAGPKTNNISDSQIYTKLLQDRLKTLQATNPQLAQQVGARIQEQRQADLQQTANNNALAQQNRSMLQAASFMPNMAPQNLSNGIPVTHPQQSNQPPPQGMGATFPGGYRPEDIVQMLPEQRAALQAQMRQISHPPGGAQGFSGPGQMPNNPMSAKEARFNHILREVNSAFANMPPPHALDLPLKVKKEMVIKCQQVMSMVNSMETIAKEFFILTTNEQLVRDSLNWCHVIRRQKLKEMEFSIDANELQQHISKVQKFFSAVVALKKKVASDRQQQLAGTAPEAVQSSTASATVEQQPQKAGAKVAGKAGAAEQPYVQSPHGTPIYAAPRGNFQAENLRIQRTKQKKEQEKAAATATSSLQQATPQIGNPRMDMQDEPVLDNAVSVAATQANLPFKCPIPQCDDKFATEVETNTHAQTHGYNNDALEWCLSNMRRALGLDNNGKSVIKAGDNASASRDRKPDQKLGTLTSSTLPMSRTGTQVGMKGQGIGNTLKAPQPGFKPGSPDSSGTAMKRTHSALTGRPATPALNGLQTATITLAKPSAPADPWAMSLVSRDAISLAFSDIKGFTDNPLAHMPSPPLPNLTDQDTLTPESLKSTDEEKEKEPGTAPVLRIRQIDWEPFDAHKGLEVEFIDTPIEGGWQYDEHAGLDDDDVMAKWDTQAWMSRRMEQERKKEEEQRSLINEFMEKHGMV